MTEEKGKPTSAELLEMYQKLNPENKEKFWRKYCELLAEQEVAADSSEAREPGTASEGPQFVYVFDCLDGILSERFWSPAELAETMHGPGAPGMTEKEIKSIAHNYEATLYRYEINASGEPVNQTCIYDCLAM